MLPSLFYPSLRSPTQKTHKKVGPLLPPPFLFWVFCVGRSVANRKDGSEARDNRSPDHKSQRAVISCFALVVFYGLLLSLYRFAPCLFYAPLCLLCTFSSSLCKPKPKTAIWFLVSDERYTGGIAKRLGMQKKGHNIRSCFSPTGFVGGSVGILWRFFMGSFPSFALLWALYFLSRPELSKATHGSGKAAWKYRDLLF